MGEIYFYFKLRQHCYDPGNFPNVDMVYKSKNCLRIKSTSIMGTYKFLRKNNVFREKNKKNSW